MKAILVEQLGSIENLVFREHELPPPSMDQVLIEVEYAGVNFPDILIVQGKYQFQPELPFSPGGEVAGVVKATGEGVDHLKPGDRVVSGTGWGGFAEEALGFASNTFVLPEAVTTRDAAAIMMTHGTVIHALKDRARLRNGETLVVLGASGGVGTAAIQQGKLMGAKVIAAASSDEKLAFCKQNGADELINYTSENLKEQIRVFTDGWGADVIVDPTGSAFSEQAFRGIARGGRHLVVGFATGNVPAIPWNLPLLKSASIVGVFWGGFFRNESEKNAENIKLLLQWLAEGKIISTVDKVFLLEEAKEALLFIEKRKVKGKVLLATGREYSR